VEPRSLFGADGVVQAVISAPGAEKRVAPRSDRDAGTTGRPEQQPKRSRCVACWPQGAVVGLLTGLRPRTNARLAWILRSASFLSGGSRVHGVLGLPLRDGVDPEDSQGKENLKYTSKYSRT